MIWADVLWTVLGVGLLAYALTGGADLGAGFWSAFAWGPRKAAQRRAVAQAIGPIWEANHVWLIFVIVVMFSAFSRAFAAICVALHIPLAVALLGLVLRGAAYVFYAYGIQSPQSRDRWTIVFAWSSVVTPTVLGTVIGGVSTSKIRWQQGSITTGFVEGWTTPFAGLVGLFALALFTMLAAVYLAADTDGELAEDFRKRALASEIVAGVLAALVFWRAQVDAPDLYANLARSAWTWPLQLTTAVAALMTLYCLHSRRLRWSRWSAAVQVGMVVVGWGAAMNRHFILPDVSLESAVPHPEVLPYLTLVLALGSVILAPALWYLFRVFKSASPAAPPTPTDHHG